MSFIRIADIIYKWFGHNNIKRPTVILLFDDHGDKMKTEIALMHELAQFEQSGKFPSLVGGVTLSGVHFVLEVRTTVPYDKILSMLKNARNILQDGNYLYADEIDRVLK